MSWQAFSWTEIQARTPRISVRWVPAISLTDSRAIEIMSLMAAFLTPFAAMEAALGVWRLLADLKWAGAFFIDDGVLSHWQVWFALAAFTQAASVFLSRALLLAKRAEPVKR